ncbi:MAG TPA: Uma2 family endonuclease [Chloroflexota bacterium]|jgi:Uma2 family endonuclease
MAEPLRKRWTVADVEALPYDEWRRYEIIDGELFVSIAARYEHQMTQKQIVVALDRWNGESQLGQVIPTPGVIFAISDAVIPDVVWISRERLAALLDDSGHLQGAPELMVEVLSPGRANERRDREIKLKQYSRYSVQEYWLLDWQGRTVDVYRQSPAGMILAATLHSGDTLTSPVLPGFSAAVARLFAW